MKIKLNPPNKEGITFREWLRAAKPPTHVATIDLMQAWERGEDPTDWRAHYAQQGKVKP